MTGTAWSRSHRMPYRAGWIVLFCVLSTGCALGEREHLIVEQEKQPGGLCRSFQVDGFTYDLTGHLLHLRDDKIRNFVDSILPEDSWNFIQRRSWIYSHDMYTPYPFQANTHGLPPQVIRDCVLGFVQTLLDSRGEDPGGYRAEFCDLVGRAGRLGR